MCIEPGNNLGFYRSELCLRLGISKCVVFLAGLLIPEAILLKLPFSKSYKLEAFSNSDLPCLPIWVRKWPLSKAL